VDSRNPNPYISHNRGDFGPRRASNVESAQRKLIRPSLTDFKEQPNQQQYQQQRKPPMKRPSPPEQTNAENFYYVKQMQARTPMVIVLNDGEEIRGIIEWYDRGCIKVHRNGGPNLLVYKSNVKYLFKESDKNEQPPVAEPRAEEPTETVEAASETPPE